MEERGEAMGIVCIDTFSIKAIINVHFYDVNAENKFSNDS